MMQLLKQLVKDQRGYATLTLALIGLMLAGFLARPYLVNLQTHLLAVQKADTALSSSSSAGAGVEHAIYRILNEPGFTDPLNPSNPTVTYNETINGEDVPITVTKVYPEGYSTPPAFTPDSAIDITKTVTPNTVVSGVATDYTYTITIENISSNSVDITAITDELPLGLTYKGPTSGFFNGDPVVQTIAGRQVLRWLPAQATWSTNADDISLGAAQLNAWTDIDLSPYVPVGTTGAVVEVINDAPANIHRGMVRGTEDTRDYMAGTSDGKLHNKTHRWQMVKVDSARKIQGYSTSTSVLFKLLGHTTSTDPKYFANPADITPTTTAAWTTVDVTSLVDADADGVILLVYSASASDLNYGIREVGSTYSTTTKGLREHQNTMYMVGLDTGDVNTNSVTKEFDAWIQTTEMKIYLVGQTKGAFVFYTDDIAVADPPLGSWQALDADTYAVPSQASGLLLLAETQQKKRISFRHGDGTDDWGVVGGQVDNNSHIQAIIGLGTDNHWDEWMEGASTDVYIAGYLKGPVPMAPAEIKTLTFVATGTLTDDPGGGGPWWNTSWQNRRKITFDNSGPQAGAIESGFTQATVDGAVYGAAAPGQGFIDPDGDVAGSWTPTPSGSHFATVDDAVRDPSAPNEADYVTGNQNSTPETYSFTTLTDVSSVSQVDFLVRWKHSAGDPDRLLDITLRWGGADQQTIRSAASSASFVWETFSFTGLALTQAQLDSLEVKLTALKTGGGPTGTWTVAAVYGDVTYTQAAGGGGPATHNGTSPTVVFTDDQTGYVFYRDADGSCVYSKTTDGGTNWGAAVTVDAQTDCLRIAVWYDRWTPGDTTGNYIHIATIDSGSGDVWYTRLDTSTDTLTTTVNATGANQGGTLDESTMVSITKGTDGDLYLGLHDDADSFIIKCGSACDQAPGVDWWNTSWLNRIKITFANLGGEVLTDFPVLVSLTDPTNIDYAKTKDLGEDIRFIDDDDLTELSYEIEKWDETGTSTVWIKVPQIDASNTDFIWMYYNNTAATDAQNTTAVWSNGYAGVWHLDEDLAGTGNVDLYKDSTTNANHGDDFVSATGQGGKVDGGQEFDGSNDHIGVADSASLDITGDITLSAWIYSTAEQGQYTKVVAKEKGGGSSYPYQLDFGSSANDKIRLQIWDGTAIPYVYSTADIPQNTWTRVDATYDGATQRMYIDGGEDATNETTKIITTNNEILNIGGRAVAFEYVFTGLIDEVRVSTVARSADWIAAQYKSMTLTFNTFSAEQEQTWWDTSWQNRRKITFDNSASAVTTVEVRVSTDNDDAEECLDDSAMSLTSTDLELINDPSCGAIGDQEVGMRFQNVAIPPGANITTAYIEFETDETDSGATSVTFYGQAADNPGTFTSTAGDITGRTKTTASVAWNNIPAWNTVDEKHQTPDLAPIIQEIVDRGGWASGNAMVVIVTGSGERTAEAYDGEPAAAPLLHVEYSAPADLIDFPVLVSLTSANIDYTKTQDSGEDIRFIDADDTTQLAYEIEKWSEAGTSDVWVKVPQIDAGSTTDFIWIYYNNPSASDAQNVAGVWSNGYVGVWHLDETPANGVAGHDDSTGNPNDGTPQNFDGTAGSTTNATGQIGGADNFDGINDSVNGGSDVSLDDLGPMTISAWVNPDPAGINSFGEILAKHDGSSAGWLIEIDDTAPEDQAFEVRVEYATTNLNKVTDNLTVSYDAWQHVVFTWDGSTSASNVHIYKNGSELGYQSSTDAAGARNSDAATTFNMASRSDGSGPLDGLIDEVRISNVVRSGNWILAQYRSQNNTFNTFDPEEVFGTQNWTEAGANPLDLDPNDWLILMPLSGANVMAIRLDAQEPQEQWWNTSWLDRIKITFNNASSTTDLVDFPVLASLTDPTNIDYGKTQDLGEDIRFIDADGTTQLAYEIEKWDEAGTSAVWAKVPKIDAGSTTDHIWMYYNNTAATDAQNATGVWSNGYVGVWHLDETPANGVAGHDDSTGNPNDGTPNNFDGTAGVSTTSGAGQIDGADRFDGTNDTVNVSHQAYFTQAPFTASAWVKFDQLPSAKGEPETIVKKNDSTCGPGICESWWLRGASSDDRLSFAVQDSGAVYHTIKSDGSIGITGWYQVVGTLNASYDMRLYVDGVQQSATANSGSIITADSLLRFGAHSSGFDRLDGTIDEVRISNVARSADWITAQYKSQNNTFNTFSAEQELWWNPSWLNRTKITFSNGGNPRTVEVRVTTNDDVAEECLDDSSMSLTSTDLELINDPSCGAIGDQEVGMRFLNVTVPQGSTITGAYIEFETDATDSGATSLTFYGQAADNPGTFTSTAGDITGRTKTTASVAWNNIPAWDTVDEKHQTPDLAPIIQEIVDRGGWASGNAMVVIVTGSGERSAEAYSDEPAAAPLLHVEYEEALTDFPVLVSLTDPTNIDYAKTKDLGEDIRFIDADGTTQLAYEIEKWDEAGTSTVWAKVPKIDAGSTTDYIWMYYNNAAATDAQNPAGVWSNGYVGVWHLDETPANGVAGHDDSTGNPNDATPLSFDGVVGSRTNGAGQIDGADEFDGVDDVVDAGSDAVLDDLGPLTISAWVKPDTYGASNAPAIITKNDGGGIGRWLFEIDNTAPEANAIAFAKAHATTGIDVSSSNSVITIGSWQQVVATWDGSVNVSGVHLYVNGLETGYGTTQAAVGSPVSDAAVSVFFGARGNATSAFHGTIDEVRISNVVRSADWIAAQYKSQNNTFNTFAPLESAPPESVDLVQSKVFNDAGGTWDGTWANIDINAPKNTTYIGHFGATVNKASGDIYLAYAADVATLGTDDIRTAVYSSGAWVAKADVLTNDAKGITGVKIAINENNDNIYVVYTAQTTPGTATTGNVYWKKSTDVMATWGVEQGPVNTAADDIYGARVNLMSDERIYVTWVGDTPDDLFGITIADLVPDGTSDTLVDFPVLISLTDTASIDYAKTRDLGEDIRFIDDDGTTELPYEIEKWDETGTSTVWVKVPQIDVSSTTDFIWIYYNNPLATDAQNATAVWSNGYVGVWHLDESPANGVAGHDDSTGNPNDATPLSFDGVVGSRTNGAGQIDGADEFDGVDDVVDAGSDAVLDDLGPLTVSAWVKPDTYGASNTPTIVGKNDGVLSIGRWILEIENTVPEANAIAFVKSHATTNINVASSNNVITIGSWQQVVATWDGSVNVSGVHLYVDGQETGYGATQAAVGSPMSDAAHSVFFGDRGNATSALHGTIDEVRISNVVRPADWIAAQYKSQNNTFNTFDLEESAPTGGGATYTNQAAAEGTGLVVGGVATGATAPIAVGGGGPEPDKIIRVDKSVGAYQGVGFQLETYTYTITATNITGGPSVTINDIFDILPRFWNYETGSSLLNGSPIADPTITLDPPADFNNDQQTLQWTVNQAFNGGDTLTLEFQASASVDKGDYDNEALITTDHDFFPYVSSGKTARISVTANYDILVPADSITVAARVQETTSGALTIDSIQYK